MKTINTFIASIKKLYNHLKPGTKTELWSCVVLALTLVITSVFSYINLRTIHRELNIAEKTSQLSFDFKLVDEFPIYAKFDKSNNGEWIQIPYIFSNNNEYDIYYRVSWLLFAENLDGAFAPTATNFVYNDWGRKASKNNPMIKDSLMTLIGRPQIDYVRDKKGRIQIIVIIEVFDKQGSQPKITEQSKNQEVQGYEGIYTEDGKFSWKRIPVAVQSAN